MRSVQFSKVVQVCENKKKSWSNLGSLKDENRTFNIKDVLRQMGGFTPVMYHPRDLKGIGAH